VHPIPDNVHRGHGDGSRRVFEQFAWLEVGSGKMALSCPAWWLTGEAVSKPTSGYPAESMRGLRTPLARSFAVGLEKYKPMKIKELMQNRFIKKWIGLNLLGWYLGLLIGPFLFGFIIIPNAPDSIYGLLDPLQPAILSFLFGIGVGFTQQIVLRRWNVSPYIWILATAFGIAMPITLFSWLLNSGVFDNVWGVLVEIAVVFLMGLGIGGLQAILLQNKVSKVSSWVRAYVVGFPALGVAAAVIILVAFALAEPIEKFLYSLGLWKLVYYRDGLLILSIGIALPFLAALFIGLPTGRILQSSDDIQFPIEEKDEEPPEAKLAIH
jgi:hypothetical protein